MSNVIVQYLSEQQYITGPQDLLDATSKIRYVQNKDDDTYIVKQPREVYQKGEGVCYDIVEMERWLLEGLKYKVGTFFAFEKHPITDNPTHTFVIFIKGDGFYWFESSWVAKRGIHGPFKTCPLAVDYVCKQLRKNPPGWKSVNVIEYKKFNYSNKTINEFGLYIVKKYPIIHRG